MLAIARFSTPLAEASHFEAQLSVALDAFSACAGYVSGEFFGSRLVTPRHRPGESQCALGGCPSVCRSSCRRPRPILGGAMSCRLGVVRNKVGPRLGPWRRARGGAVGFVCGDDVSRHGAGIRKGTGSRRDRGAGPAHVGAG